MRRNNIFNLKIVIFVKMTNSRNTKNHRTQSSWMIKLTLLLALLYFSVGGTAIPSPQQSVTTELVVSGTRFENLFQYNKFTVNRPEGDITFHQGQKEINNAIVCYAMATHIEFKDNLRKVFSFSMTSFLEVQFLHHCSDDEFLS